MAKLQSEVLNLSGLIVVYAVGTGEAKVEGEMVLAAYPEATLRAMIIYGARRMLQDSVNSQAHAARQDGEDVDYGTLVAARLGTFADGKVGVRAARGPGLDDQRAEELRIVYQRVVARLDKAGRAKAAKWKASERREKMGQVWDSLPEAKRAEVTAEARETLARKAAKPDDLDVDLSDLGL